MSSINDESLLLEFVAESREHLSSIEPDLLILEEEGAGTSSEIINRVFRAIHSIKGASGFFGLEALKSLSHSMENVLMLIRDGKLSPTPAVMDPLLIGVDRLRLMLDDVQASEKVTFQDVVQALEQLIAGDEAPHSKQQSTPADTASEAGSTPEPTSSLEFNPDRAAVEAAIKNGQGLYRIEVSTENDLSDKGRTAQQLVESLISMGVVLDTIPNLSNPANMTTAPSESTLSFLYASVLEADLLAMSLEIDEVQLTPLHLTDLLPSLAEPEAAPEPQAEANSSATEPSSSPAEKAEPIASPATLQPAKTTTTSQSGDSNETIRVKVDLLNRLMDLAGELVLARNQLTRVFENIEHQLPGMGQIIQNVDLVTSDLQEHIMQTRMQPISSVFGKFPRLVRDLSKILNKEIQLQMSGEEVELDKSILESLSDPLTHLIRNCCDHGMEMPDTRTSTGKARQGTILLKAYQESGHINIAVMDDGAGIDHERIAKKALENGLISEGSLRQMSVQEQVNLIFMPGFSTAEHVTEVSGRGVGMDVVRTNIEQIGGTISIETERGKGTSILLRLPLTLAIIPSLVVSSAGQTFAVPQINLVELVCVTASQIGSQIEKVGSAPVLRLRGKLLPLIKLNDVLKLESRYVDPESGQELSDRRVNVHDLRMEGAPERNVPERRERQSDYNILVVKSGVHQYGLIVDEIKDIEEIVVKPLSQFVKNCKCFSGATIMGDGRVAMILDVGGIVATSGLSFSEVNFEEERRALEQSGGKNDEEQQKESVLLFNCYPSEIFAIPLASILRLEKMQLSAIETVGNHRFLPYQGRSMSLIFLDEYLPVRPIPNDTQEAYLIIPNCGEQLIGIVASSIIDTIEIAMRLEPSLINHPGISGSSVINNHVTLFINPQGLLSATGADTPSKRSAGSWQADHLQPSS